MWAIQDVDAEGRADTLGLTWWAVGTLRGARALEMHFAILPAWQGRWMTRGLYLQLWREVATFRPQILLAQASSPQVTKIWSGLGFTRQVISGTPCMVLERE